MMETTIKTDVIIVGAGPTGLSLAAQLMRYGIDFVIFDQKEGLTELSKALVVHARTLEIYDQIGLAEKAVAGGERLQKGVLTHDGKVSARLDFSDFGGQLSPFPFLLIFEQNKNERLLYDHLLQHGQAVQWQTELESLTQDLEGVKAVVKTKGGEMQTIEAAYLVGCDGARSSTRHALGLNFCGSTQPRLFYVADVEMEFPGDRNAFGAVMGEDSFVLIVPMQGDNRWRLIGNLPEYESQIDQEIMFDAIETKVKRLTKTPIDITKVHWFSSYKVGARRAETFSSGRCFLAGDAAHIHTPAGGQGMNTGIQDAYNLAWKLAFVFQGRAAHSLLETYSEERVANAIRLLETTDQFFDVAASDRWYLRFFRGNILPMLASLVSQFSPAKEFLFPVVSQIALNYEGKSLSQPQQRHKFAVKAGDRMPYFLVEGENIYDRLRAAKFHLLLFSDGQHDNSGLKLAAECADCVDLHIVPLYPRVVEIFGREQSFQVLLRPDHYIAFLESGASLEPCKTYFEQILRS